LNIRLSNLQSLFAQTCAAILWLAAPAQAEDEAEARPDQSASATAMDSEPTGGPADRGALMAPPGSGGPSGEPPRGPGAPPGEGPPRMAVGQSHVGILTRVDLSADVNKLDEPLSTLLAGVAIVARVQENFTLTTGLAASYDARDASGVVSILDAIIQFEPTPALNVWLGRMVEPVDRSTLSGPGFVAPWYFTGFGHIDGQIPLPLAGFLGRSNGATVWGSLFTGHLKYYASAFDLVTPGESPLFTGRINLALLNPEPGYYHSSSYFGKDILAIGVGAQSKKRGSVNLMTQQRSDYAELSVDLLFEKDMGAAGVFDIEGAYYKFTGDYERTSSSWLGLASYLVPGQIAGVRLQPLVRVQQALPAAPDAPTSTLIDGQLSFLLNGHAARIALGYRRAYAGPLESSSVFLGIQLIQL
jgi:hypothetical protein